MKQLPTARTSVVSPASTMRIAVVGAGAIGSTIAFQLAKVGRHDVTAIARPGSARLAQLERDDGVVRTTGERAHMRVDDLLDETIAYDLVIVTVLAHQVDAVLPALSRSAARRIQFMFNMFEPERLREAVGAERTSFGMPFLQAMIGADGRLHATIGAGGQACKMDDRTAIDVFVGAGLPAAFEPNMPLWLRSHVPLGVALESICVAAKRRGGGAAWTDALRTARGMHESFVLLARLGYRVYPSGKALLARTPVPLVASMLFGASRIPSFRDLLATGEGECRALVDVLLAHAASVQPPVSIATIAAMKPESRPGT
jgi:2-dehydropantoate 2-reductase